MNKYRLIVLLVLILAAVTLRFLPQPPNFTPVAALSLFAGAFFRDPKWAIIAPLAVLLLSDLFLGWHDTLLYVYGSFILMVFMGRSLRDHLSTGYIAGAGITGSMLFFLITNFGVWMSGSLYPKTWEGLMAAYIAAIPFLHNMIISTLLYSTLLFGLFMLAEGRIPAIRENYSHLEA